MVNFREIRTPSAVIVPRDISGVRKKHGLENCQLDRLRLNQSPGTSISDEASCTFGLCDKYDQSLWFRSYLVTVGAGFSTS
ncbi:unnamed protein product [Schistosoma haematobium]|nr:unnamed protein product [Schistosoma haematobium]